MIHPFIDLMAERITLLGGFARGTSRQTAAATSVEKFPDGPQDGETYLRELQTRYAEHADNSRKHAEASAEDDPTTEDLFIEVSRAVDQALYFIEAHLNQKKKRSLVEQGGRDLLQAPGIIQQPSKSFIIRIGHRFLL